MEATRATVWVQAQTSAHEAFELAEVLAERADGTLRVRVSSGWAAKDLIVRLGFDAWVANPVACSVSFDLTALPEIHPAALLHSLAVRYGRGEYFSCIGPDCLLWISPC